MQEITSYKYNGRNNMNLQGSSSTNGTSKRISVGASKLNLPQKSLALYFFTQLIFTAELPYLIPHQSSSLGGVEAELKSLVQNANNEKRGSFKSTQLCTWAPLLQLAL